MPFVTLPIAEYAPDMPAVPGQSSGNIRNVVPLTQISYGPVKAPSVFTNALTARCQGAVGFIDKNLAITLFAGDATKLYRLRAAEALAWADVTNSGGAYSIGSDSQWEFEYFNGSVIATDYTDNVQTFNVVSDSTFSDLSANAPKARHIAVVKNSFVVLGNTTDGVNGALDQRVWWSGAGNATSWPTPGGQSAAQLQSGAVDLTGNDGPVQAIRSGLAGADGLVFLRYGIKRMMYAGPPVVFEFLPAEGLRGTPAPYSPVVMGGIVYYLAFDGFYASDGVSSKAIGANRIDKTFYADLSPSYIDRVTGAADPLNKLIWWCYPGQGNVGGNPNRLLAYNWELDRWSICDVTSETICRMMGIGYTLDELYTVLGYTLETLPAPLDSQIWQGGALQLGLFDSNHKLNYLTGDNLAATIETSEMEPIPGKRGFVRNSRPLVDGGTPTVSISHRERLQDAATDTAAISLNSLGNCPVRTSGRYMKGTIATLSGDSWTHASGLEIDIVQQGSR